MTSGQPKSTPQFSLVIRNSPADELRFDLPAVEGYIIGRSDTQSPISPDVDLLPFGGREFGVSRRHAALVMYQSAVHIVDLESSNGTFINQERIPSNQACLLKDGDVVMLGELEINFRLS